MLSAGCIITAMVSCLFPAKLKLKTEYDKGQISGFFPSYLEFLSSNGLHITLLADGELVGDRGVCGVDLGPGEVVAVLGDLCDQLVVAALLNDCIGDT